MSEKFVDKDADAFIGKVAHLDLAAPGVFQKLFNEGLVLAQISDDDLAARFKISKDAVSRWKSGTHVPPQAAREQLLAWVKECVLVKSKYAN